MADRHVSRAGPASAVGDVRAAGAACVRGVREGEAKVSGIVAALRDDRDRLAEENALLRTLAGVPPKNRGWLGWASGFRYGWFATLVLSGCLLSHWSEVPPRAGDLVIVVIGLITGFLLGLPVWPDPLREAREKAKKGGDRR